ncbi:alpha/beta hydrolase [Actinomadura welshii]
MRKRIWTSRYTAWARRKKADGARPAAPAAPRRRLAAGLLAVAVAGGAACDAAGDSGGAPPRRVEAKATNPPPGLPAAFTTGQRLGWSACTAPPGGGDAPRDGWECATMKAPLDYRRPGGDTIDVALIRRRATGPERRRIGSLVFNFGGPGQSGVAGLPRYADDYASLAERYDLVGFDPRGVGLTAPVRCGEKEFEGADACNRHSGRLLPHVGTSQTARDLDLMRYLLGDERLNYFGVSYGTVLGGTYAHLFPKHVGRLVLEAPVDPTQNRLEGDLSQARAVQLAFDRFAAHCARTYGDCPTGTDPGQATARAVALLDRLKAKPAPTGGDERLDADLAARAIANHLDLGEQGWRSLVEALHEVMGKGTGAKLWEEAYDHGPRGRAGRVTRVDNGTSAFVSITCADSSLRPGFLALERWIERIEAASPVFGEAWAGTVYLCHGWPFRGERADPDVSAAGAPPILVVANTGDPTTPYAGAERMARELGEGVGVLLRVRAEGHGSYLHNRCAAKAVDTYLLDGTAPVAAC